MRVSFIFFSIPAVVVTVTNKDVSLEFDRVMYRRINKETSNLIKNEKMQRKLRIEQPTQTKYCYNDAALVFNSRFSMLRESGHVLYRDLFL